MRAILALGPAALLLSACASPRPYSEPGVGFSDYASYQAQREAQLTGQTAGAFSAPAALPATSPYGLPPGAMTTIPPGGIASADLAAAGIGGVSGGAAFGGPPVPTATLGAPPPPGITAAGMAQPNAFSPAPGGTVAVASSGVAGDVNTMRSTGLEASPSNAAPMLMGAVPTTNPSVPATTGTGISDEQDFNAVSSRESIESDAARRAQQASQYQVVQPTALPPAPASTGPNIVEYALSAPNSKGQAWYSRFVFSGEGRQLRNCGQYGSPDEAQRDFLTRGGPERDPRGLDPDGDGFACAWDPAPFRAAVGRG